MWIEVKAKDLQVGDWLNWGVGHRLLGPIASIRQDENGQLRLAKTDNEAIKWRWPNDPIYKYVDPATGGRPGQWMADSEALANGQ